MHTNYSRLLAPRISYAGPDGRPMQTGPLARVSLQRSNAIRRMDSEGVRRRQEDLAHARSGIPPQTPTHKPRRPFPFASGLGGITFLGFRSRSNQGEDSRSGDSNDSGDSDGSNGSGSGSSKITILADEIYPPGHNLDTRPGPESAGEEWASSVIARLSKVLTHFVQTRKPSDEIGHYLDKILYGRDKLIHWIVTTLVNENQPYETIAQRVLMKLRLQDDQGLPFYLILVPGNMSRKPNKPREFKIWPRRDDLPTARPDTPTIRFYEQVATRVVNYESPRQSSTAPTAHSETILARTLEQEAVQRFLIDGQDSQQGKYYHYYGSDNSFIDPANNPDIVFRSAPIEKSTNNVDGIDDADVYDEDFESYSAPTVSNCNFANARSSNSNANEEIPLLGHAEAVQVVRPRGTPRVVTLGGHKKIGAKIEQTVRRMQGCNAAGGSGVAAPAPVRGYQKARFLDEWLIE